MTMDSAKMCRVCHKSSGIHIDLFAAQDGKQYIEEMSQYLSIKVNRNDGLSSLICHLCIFHLSLCSQLSKAYSLTYNADIMEPVACDGCCICREADNTIQVDQQTTNLIEKAKNCFSSKDNCPLLKETGTKFLCEKCTFKLSEVSQFYSSIHRDVCKDEESLTIATANVKVKPPQEVKSELVGGKKEEEEPIIKKGQTTYQYGPSTTRWPKNSKPHSKCPICKNKRAGRSDSICTPCMDYSKKVRIVLTDLKNSVKL
ncbi:uncharacterized protein LOC111049645 isoform X4 [Nilaparvata lugens]|uniref:uncharacterized protein LOC111049645 isoform X4 n=1 Tax=Nilaparvata lugens TaxID=108931 RepID=UPI00193DCBD5|nr:uncharacterized protein LOC111049645 isoform X4 [Nilaparvata lugens]